MRGPGGSGGPPPGTLPVRRRPPPPTGTPARGPFQAQDRELLASDRAGVGDFRQRCPRGLSEKDRLGLLPRPRGAGGVAGLEPSRRLGPCRLGASVGEPVRVAAVSASRSAQSLGSRDRTAVGEPQSTVPNSA